MGAEVREVRSLWMLEHGSRMGQRFRTALFVGDRGSDEDGRGAGPSSSRALPPCQLIIRRTAAFFGLGCGAD